MIKKYVETISNILYASVITDAEGNIITDISAHKQIIDRLEKLRRNKKTLYIIGNGGSNAIASHAAIDFLNTCKIKVMPLVDSSQITCMANDFGYENVFSKSLEIMMERDDVLIAISSSGMSKNIINAVELFKQKKGYIITYSGFNKNNKLAKLGNINFWLNSKDYGQVEIGHALLIHLLTDTFRDIT